MIVAAPSGETILLNRQTQQIAERYLGSAQLSGIEELRELHDSGVFELYRPDGRPYEVEEWPVMRTLASGEEIRDEDVIQVMADGSRLTIRCNCSPIYDDEGRIVAGVLVTQEITEHKQAEQKTRFQADLLGAVGQAVIATDLEGRITYWNRSAQDLYGFSAEETMGRFVVDVIPSEAYRERAEQIMLQLRTGRNWSGEFEVRRKDGTIFPAMVTDTPVRDEQGNLVGIIGISTDITERKLAEQEIERRTHQQAVVAELGLRALANDDLQDLMDDAATLVAQTLGVEYAKVVELLPGGQELLMRAGVGWKEGLVGEARESAGEGSEAGYTLHSDEPVIMKDLSTEERFAITPLLAEHGVVSGMSVVIHGREAPFGALCTHSTSYRSFSEDDVNFLQSVANVLATAIERQGAQERVEDVREAERSRIARDLHDDALQDLSGALVDAQLLRSQLICEDPEAIGKAEQLLEALDRIGPRLRGAIYDLRLEAEQDMPFSELLESLVELQRAIATNSEITLEMRGESLSGSLGKTGGELLRILREALINARRHSGAEHVRVRVCSSEEKLSAEVEDDGQGFDQEQEPSSTTHGGMGIRAMRERAKSLGGELKMESEPGQGTKMHFELVLQRALEEAEQQEEEVVHILLVDDHASIREALAAAFEGEEGFEVVGQAGSVAEAREILEQMYQEMDVAIIDLGLPDGHGADLIKELREKYPQAQALVLSASLDRANIARAVEQGAAVVLSKTAHLEKVVQAVRRLRAGETLMPLEEVVGLLRFAGSQREQEYEARQAIEKLTPREIEVLQALALGLDSEGIAQNLHIALRTERNHMASILAKLGVHSQLQALVFALKYGVVDGP
jgi:PAS domain S-box-containing protein